jgi:3-oxoacyl-[acyl-carrier-protein] synthase-3
LADRVLLLVGDVSSQSCHPTDAATLPIFGDAGTACLIEATEVPGIGAFHFETDGNGWDLLATPVGGRRYPTMNDFQVRASEHDKQRFRYPEHINMDGDRVFAFCMEKVPGFVDGTLQANGCTRETVDFTIFHQANLMMLEALRRKSRLPKETFLSSIEQFGNTSVATIPVTMSHSRERLRDGGRVLIVGFGIGLSLAGTIVRLDPGVVLPPIVEVR